MQLFLGIMLLVMSIFLVVAVLFQQGKSHRLPGAISGGAETFFGKNKSRQINTVLSKVTAIVAIVFVIVVIVVYILAAPKAPEVTLTPTDDAQTETTDNVDTTDDADVTEDTADTTEDTVETTEDTADTTEVQE